MIRPKMPDWRTEPSQIDWSDMRYSSAMSNSQTGVVERNRQRGVEMSPPISGNSPGGLATDYVSMVKDGTPAYRKTLVDLDRLRELRTQGLTLVQIAKKLGVARRTIDVAHKKLKDQK